MPNQDKKESAPQIIKHKYPTWWEFINWFTLIILGALICYLIYLRWQIGVPEVHIIEVCQGINHQYNVNITNGDLSWLK